MPSRSKSLSLASQALSKVENWHSENSKDYSGEKESGCRGWLLKMRNTRSTTRTSLWSHFVRSLSGGCTDKIHLTPSHRKIIWELHWLLKDRSPLIYTRHQIYSWPRAYRFLIWSASMRMMHHQPSLRPSQRNRSSMCTVTITTSIILTGTSRKRSRKRTSKRIRLETKV